MMAVEPVDGAFGYKFGSVVDLGRVVKVETNYFGEVMIDVKPEVPDPDFLEYNLEVVPSDSRICRIQARKNYQTKAEAETAMRACLEKLELKYGPSKPIPDSSSVSIKCERGFVLVQIIEGTRSISLVVTYQATKLSEIAEMEAKAAKKKSASPSQVEGAFGFTLGEVFYVSKAIGEVKTTSGYSLLEVKPPTPNEYFNRYYLSVTPKTKRIHQIWAQGDVKDEAEGATRQEAIGKIQIAEGVA